MRHYIATIKLMEETETKTGKISYKTRTEKYLVNSNSIPDVHKTMKKVLQGIYDTFEISGVTESTIVGYIDETVDVLSS